VIRKLRTATIGIVVTWFLVLCAVVPITAAKSTRQVLAETTRVLGSRIDTTKVYFAGRAPHSAFFYAPGMITQRSPEEVRDSLRRFASADDGSLLIIRESEWKKLPQDHLPPVHLLVEVPGWKVVTSVAADQMAASVPIGARPEIPKL
jgi:hypothetical protein